MLREQPPGQHNRYRAPFLAPLPERGYNLTFFLVVTETRYGGGLTSDLTVAGDRHRHGGRLVLGKPFGVALATDSTSVSGEF